MEVEVVEALAWSWSRFYYSPCFRGALKGEAKGAGKEYDARCVAVMMKVTRTSSVVSYSVSGTYQVAWRKRRRRLQLVWLGWRYDGEVFSAQEKVTG